MGKGANRDVRRQRTADAGGVTMQGVAKEERGVELASEITVQHDVSCSNVSSPKKGGQIARRIT